MQDYIYKFQKVAVSLGYFVSNRHETEFVFSGWRIGSGLSNGAMLALMKKIDFGPYTPHGFRSTFRDWAADEAQ